MKFSDLIQYKNGQMAVTEKAFFTPSVGQGASSQIASIPAHAGGSKAGKLLGTPVLEVKAGTSGLWIPYIANRTVYGYLTGGQSWVVSGPFSGCYMEVGQHGGQTYAAHISCEGKDDANVAAWDAVLPGRTILFRAKIGMARDLPVGARNVAAIVFASLAGGKVEATRVDVQTASAGGMSGPIFDVQLVANAA